MFSNYIYIFSIYVVPDNSSKILYWTSLHFVLTVNLQIMCSKLQIQNIEFKYFEILKIWNILIEQQNIYWF